MSLLSHVCSFGISVHTAICLPEHADIPLDSRTGVPETTPVLVAGPPFVTCRTRSALLGIAFFGVLPSDRLKKCAGAGGGDRPPSVAVTPCPLPFGPLGTGGDAGLK